MKRIKLVVGLLVAFVILGTVSPHNVSAQTQNLDGVWLKCKANVKGYVHDPGTGDYFKSNGTLPLYLHFVWNSDHYDIAVWTFVDGAWKNTSNTAEDTVYPGENFISNFYLQLWFFSKDYIETYHTPFIQYKYKNGTLTKVTYKGTGEVQGGKLSNGTLNYYGYFSISGTNVDHAKLPFDPYS
jgi:hypothetical protein